MKDTKGIRLETGSWLDGLPVNRKEVFYTATLLPQIISADNFRQLGKFFRLSGQPRAEDQIAEDGRNVAVISEYNLKHAESRDGRPARDFAENLDSEPELASTPDVVILLDAAPPLALVIEGKMFDTPNRGKLIKQVGMQDIHFVSSLKKRMPVGSTIVQVALLPECFAAQVRQVDALKFTIVTWQDVEKEYREVVSAQHPLKMLRRALTRWDNLVSSGSGFVNSDDTLTGLEILTRLGGDFPFKTMGRKGGLKGSLLQDDIKTGRWAVRDYEVSRNSDLPNDNWFLIDDLLKELKRHGSSRH